jgi:hypothetical protein
MSEELPAELAPETREKIANALGGTAQPATYEALIKKPRRTLSFEVTSANDAGEEIKLTLKFQAIDSTSFDELQSAHPPTTKERREGAIYNVDTFAPALIAAVSLEPRLSVEQATEIYKSPDWAPGEVGNMFINAMSVCNQGLNIPFNARD